MKIWHFANHLSLIEGVCALESSAWHLSCSLSVYGRHSSSLSLIAPLSSLRRCPIPWALINPMLPCSQACTHPPTPTANQLSHCITAAPHPPSPHASPRPHSSQAKTVTHMPTWPSTLPLMDRQVARDLQTCPSLLWMWVTTAMVVYFRLFSFLESRATNITCTIMLASRFSHGPKCFQ